jgi:hypothetical protein
VCPATAPVTIPTATSTNGIRFFDGFEVTDSFPIPRLMGVFAAIENVTPGHAAVGYF